MDETKQNLEMRGFAPGQIQEITEGIKSGLRVEAYAKNEFFSIQMRQIRLGLSEGLPVEKYARPDISPPLFCQTACKIAPRLPS